MDVGESPDLPCAGKLAFDTRQQAAIEANVAEYRYGAKLYPYLCRDCGLWHLSSKTADE